MRFTRMGRPGGRYALIPRSRIPPYRWLRIALLAVLASIASYGQCTFTVSPSPAYADSTGQTVVLQVTASAQTCGWTAASNGFATVSGGTGTGNGSVSYLLPSNTTGADRTVALTVAGNTVTLTQRFTAQVFSDVDLGPSNSFFNGTNLLVNNNITKGCQASPLLYCPDQNVTRAQMAVFIVRTVLGGGPTVDNFNYSTTPYFTDVPVTHQFFKWIQKLRDLGVTSGCTVTTYCPDANIPRNQMAIFIIRARLGTGTTFTYNPTPYFTDEPATDTTYFKYIQKLKEIGITSGCTVTTYCPNDPVTRGQMAVFLIRAGFNTLLSGTSPLISSVERNSGSPGTSVTVTLTGINTTFTQGQTTVTASDGVTAGTATVIDSTHLTVTLTIPANTKLGPVSLTAITPLSGGASEQATIPNGFLVGLGDPLPIISGFSPANGPIGTSVTLTGSGLVSSAGTPADVRMVAQGGGIVSAPVTASTVNSLTFIVPSTAATGIITVSASSGSATTGTLSPSLFTVTPSSTFTISAVPSIANVIAGQTTTYTVSVTSANGFPGLATLSLTGLPAGLTAAFVPTAVAAGGQSTLTITAPANQAPSSTQLVIGGAATVDGIAESLSTGATLNVQAVTTTFLGRAVVDDGKNTALAGVTVTMLGLDGSGNKTPCTGQTLSDASGNFALTQLPAGCIGPQLIGFGGNSVTSPAGTYAGVNLVFTLVSGQVVVSPVLVHLPRIDNVETFLVTQNSQVDQSYSYKTIPGLKVVVYAGTVFTEADGSQPNPFPLAAINVPVDRLPDVMPATTATVNAFIVAFQPANTVASAPVAVWFPNTLNTAPGTDMPLSTLDPTRGRMVPYGTGTVSSDGTTIIPDIDPSTGALQHRYGIVHFDWHGPAAPAPGGPNPGGGGDGPDGGDGGDGGGNGDGGDGGGDGGNPSGGDPVDLSSGVLVITNSDIGILNGRGSLTVKRTYRTSYNVAGTFGVGTSSNFDFRLDNRVPENQATVSIIMPNGVRYPFARQPDGTLTNTSIPRMQGVVMTTNADGTAKVKWRDGVVYSFAPAASFQIGSVMTSITDLNNNVITITRDPSTSQIQSVTDPTGRSLVFAYNGGGQVASIADPVGQTVKYAYDGQGRLVTFTDANGGTTQYTYDSNANLLTLTDQRGVVAETNTYDANQRVVSQKMGDGSVFTYAYTLINALVPFSPVQTTTLTDPRGSSWLYRFNPQGFVVEVVDPLGRHRVYTRDAGTNITLSVTGTGTCQTCGDTLAGDFSHTYDQNGNKLTSTDSRGATTTYTYDPVYNRLLSFIDALGNSTSYTYDGRGNLLTVTDPRGAVTTMTYNNFGQVTQVKGPSGAVSTMVYSVSGDRIQETGTNGRVLQMAYDGISRVLKTQDQFGHTTAFSYDGMSHVVSSTDQRGLTTNYTYNGTGDQIQVTDAKGNKSKFTYDARHRITSRTDPLLAIETFTYDAAGNLISHVDRRGASATFTYDAVARLAKEAYSDGQTVARTYDANGRLILANDSTGGTDQYTYDSGGYLLKSVGPFGNITYTRDLLGRTLTRQVSGQPVVTYSYDAAGNVTSASSPQASVQTTFDLRSLPLTMTRANGVTSTIAYDSAARLSTLAHARGGTTLSSSAFTYDPIGHRASQQTSSGLPLSTPSASATVNADNQLLTFGSHTYTYDANGNRLTDVGPSGTTSYTWDARNRLRAMQVPGGIIYAFQYDFANNLVTQRVTSTASDNLQHFLLDEDSNVVAITSAAGTSSVLTGNGPDQYFAITDPTGAVQYGLTGAVNSTTGVTDATGALVGQAFYEPFGSTTEQGQTYHFEFTGRDQVAPGLYHMRYRFYDQTTGTFISEDPAGFAGGDLNLYRYAGNNPIQFKDPSGLVREPDSYTLSGGLIVSGSITVDKFGNVYFGVGISPPFGGKSLGGSLMANYLDQTSDPTEKQIGNTTTGWSVGGGGGYIGGAQQTFSVSNGQGTTSVGLTTPGGNVGPSYTWELGNPFRWASNAWDSAANAWGNLNQGIIDGAVQDSQDWGQ